MKSLPLALGAFSILLLGGCGTYTNLNTPEAEKARQLMAQHCEVGQIRLGNPSFVTYVRVAKGTGMTNMRSIAHRHDIAPSDITIYSVKDLGGMWVETDASSNKARDNFYFNRTSGEAVCSFDEWQGQLQLTVPMPGSAPSMNSVGGGR